MLVTNQVIWFGQSILLGCFLSIIFDMFKIIRLFIKSGTVVVFIEDILFFSICSILTFLFMMNVSFGQIRFFILVGELIGAILYKLTISKLVIKIFEFLISVIKKTMLILFNFIIMPIFKIIRWIIGLIFRPWYIFIIKYYKIFNIPLNFVFQIVYNLINKVKSNKMFSKSVE